MATENINLVVVRNPFDRRIRDERTLTFDTMPSVAALVQDYLPLAPALSVSINGELITREEWESRQLRPGEQLVVMPVLHDSGNGILFTVLMIALIVFAPYVAGYADIMLGGAFGAAGSIGFGLVTYGIIAAGAYVIGGLLAQNKPPAGSSSGSQSFGWSPATTQVPGSAVARAYGTNKLYGNIIAGYIENQSTGILQQRAHILIDLGTGPYSALSDFQINNQPVGFFTGVTPTARMGNINQAAIPAFSENISTHAIGAKVVLGTPVTRTTVGDNFDALQILLSCPSGLFYANDSGGMDTHSVIVGVEISADGGATWQPVTSSTNTESAVIGAHWSLGYWQKYKSGSTTKTRWVEITAGSTVPTAHISGALDPANKLHAWRWVTTSERVIVTVINTDTLSGNTATALTQQYRVDNLNRGSYYQVRVTNYSTDYTANSRYGDAVYLAEIDEVLYDDFQYPRTVLVGLDALATNQLSGSIKFSCMGDCAIVQVWNGSAWVSQFTNNPAWVCWDILTQPVLDNSLAVARYDGLDPSRLDLPSFVAWAVFCDVLVPDGLGLGGTEKRCQFDGIFDTTTNMWDAALQVCSTARAQLVRRGTTIGVVYDDTRTSPAQLFTVGNSAVSGFSETWLEMKDRAASIEVQYLNAANQYVRDPLTVVNTNISDSTAARTSLSLVGVTRSSQAWREANFRLARNELLQRSAMMNVDIDALACTVGDLIWVQNDVTQWGIGGRAGSGSTTTHLVLDQTITLVVATTYELKLRLDDDTILTRTITTAPGDVSAVDVSVAFPSAPALYNVWAIGKTSMAVKEFVILDIARSSDQIAKLSLIEYNASLYGLDGGTPVLPTANIAALPAAPSLTGVSVEEGMTLTVSGTVIIYLDIHFTLVDAEKVVIYSKGAVLGESTTGTFRVNNVTGGQSYSFELHPTNKVGISPSLNWQTITYGPVLGKMAPPADVSGFSAVIVGDGVLLSWPANTDVDLYEYEIHVGGANWAASTYMANSLTTQLKVLPVAAGTTVWWIKAIDTSENYSVNALMASVTVSGAAVPVVTQQVIDNNVLLYWTQPVSAQTIATYEIRRGATYAGATVIGTKNGLFTTVFETVAGNFIYWVTAIDIAGNYGSPGSVAASVNQPPDYVLKTNLNSTFVGNVTLNNAELSGGTVVLPVDLTETFAAHFTAHSWTSPADQITAGYPVFAQPALLSGYYEEWWDLGATLAASKLTLVLNRLIIAGAPVTTPTISVSNTSGITGYTDYVGVTSVYATFFRWVKIRIAVASGLPDILQILGINVRIDAKLKNDAGSVACVSTDNSAAITGAAIGGTTVLFTQTFSAITSITLTAQGTTVAYTPIYDFNGAANPVGFKVYLYNAAGARVSGTVSWSAKGY